MADFAGPLRPSDSWSTTEVRSLTHNHVWTIRGFSNCDVRYLETSVKIRDNKDGHRDQPVPSASSHEPAPITFRIRLHPQGNKESNKDFSFFQVFCNTNNTKYRAKFSVYNSRNEVIPTTVYTGTQQLHGYFEYIRRDLLLQHLSPQDELRLNLNLTVTFDTVTKCSQNMKKIDTIEVPLPPSYDTQNSDESDGDSEPSKKKAKVQSVKTNKQVNVGKKNTTDLKCTECEYKTISVSSFENHLRYKHSTTVSMAGLALRCDCGFEGLSYRHGRRCDIANFTVIRKRVGPIRTFKDKKTTPQCLLCQKYPKTAGGYANHLKRDHHSSLISNGIYLLCSCGAKYRHCQPDTNHTAECNPREFTLHQIK